MVLIECLDQNISEVIKDRWEVASVARWYTPWRGTPNWWRAIGEPVQHMSASGHAQSHGDQINIQRVGRCCPLFLALYHCDGVGADGNVSAWLEEAWNEVQAAFPTSSLWRMHIVHNVLPQSRAAHPTSRPRSE